MRCTLLHAYTCSRPAFLTSIYSGRWLLLSRAPRPYACIAPSRPRARASAASRAPRRYALHRDGVPAEPCRCTPAPVTRTDTTSSRPPTGGEHRVFNGPNREPAAADKLTDGTVSIRRRLPPHAFMTTFPGPESTGGLVRCRHVSIQ